MPAKRRTDISVADLIVTPHHTAFSVEDYETAKAFFVAMLGFRVENEMKNRAEPALGITVGMPGARCDWAMLERQGHRIELFKWLEPEGRPHGRHQADIGYTHICMQVSDVTEAWRRVTAAGWEAFSEPQSLRGGAARPVYIIGPEGCIVEFLELRK